MLKDLSRVYMLEGFRYLSNKKMNSAILNLEKSILFDDNNCEAMNLLGLCFYTLGSFKEAKSIWNRSCLINSKEDNRALSYCNSLEEEEFKALYNSYNEALKNAKDGQYKKADRILKDEILIKSNIVPFIKLKGLCKLAAGNRVKAVSLWRQALEVNNEDMEVVKYIADSTDSNGEGTVIYNFFRNIFKRK